MKWLRELVDPASLASSMTQNSRFRRGAVIFLAAVAAYILSSVYYVETKLGVRYASTSIKMPSPPITEAPEVVFVTTLYLTLGFLAVIGVFSVTIYLTAAERRSLIPLFSSTMHAFLAFIVATALLLPALITTEPVELVITHAEVEEVKLENAEIVGILRSNNSYIAASPQVLRSPKLTFNYSNTEYPLLIESATARFSDSIVSLGDIHVERLEWKRIEFSGLNYVTEPRLSREPWSAVATMVSWFWVIAYVGSVCKRFYGISLRAATSSALVSLVVLLIFGLL